MMLGLRTVVYHVKDLDRAKAWYTRMLGYGPYFDKRFYVGFEVGGFELGLHPMDKGTPRGAGGTVAYWGVPRAKAAYTRLLRLGARTHSHVMDVGGGIKVGSVIDPFGNLLGVIENPHFRVKKPR